MPCTTITTYSVLPTMEATGALRRRMPTGCIASDRGRVVLLPNGRTSRADCGHDVTLLGESLQTRARAPPNLAVAQSEFARFVHLARKALNIKLGLSNAMLSLFSHMGDFTPVHAKTIILQHSGSDALRCAVLQEPSDGSVHCDPARAARTTQAQLAPPLARPRAQRPL